jgi:alkanesulfonate monooxygenase SsuD/methylene tetrahydromethanopterin reductase-like flavin-dependent oxidoreductase (luciferase family)
VTGEMVAMNYSLSLPNFGDWQDPRIVADLAREAEAAGWHGVFTWDHLYAWPGNEVGDPWAIMTAVALATERVRIGPMVTPLPRRRPWNVVRQLVTLDRLSGGRAVFGAALGYPPHEEFGVFGEPEDARTRAAKLDEGLEIVAGLQSGEPFAFAGAHHRLDDVLFAPLPLQRPRVPIWIGGSWPNRAPFRRASRWDGVIPIMARDEDGNEPTPTVEDMRAALTYTREHREGEGPFDAVFTGVLPSGRAEAAAIARELASFGVTWWQISPAFDEPPAAFLDLVRSGPPST